MLWVGCRTACALCFYGLRIRRQSTTVSFPPVQSLIPMYWTLELASHLDEAPWPATREELIDYAERTGAPPEVIENLEELEDDGEPYESMEEIWPDYTMVQDFYYED